MLMTRAGIRHWGGPPAGVDNLPAARTAATGRLVLVGYRTKLVSNGRHVTSPSWGLHPSTGRGMRLLQPQAVALQLLSIVPAPQGAALYSGRLATMASLEIGGALFSAGQQANEAVAQSLEAGSATSLLVLAFAGLLTSLSPCTLSVLPLTIGYIGGYKPANEQPGTLEGSLGFRALAFSLGLASTLALLGVGASMAGKAYGQVGAGLPLSLGVSALAIAMGLSLLEVLVLPLPSLDVDTRKFGLPASVQAYLAGAVFALAASPCSTPVLATVLAYVSTTGDPVKGGVLLLAYTLGYVSPLLLAATATDSLSKIMAARQYSAWVTPISGGLLVAGGTYGLLSRLVDL
mmetsp:Transcript_8528/g.24466  ORF Transcript_8528/g.24466 Transcript_8528/m.24466 type:complete len:347 (+) Transcript_8528:123-1163(+)|eukprot:CAMPEP_0117660198 /NCGR_PEP_ID=MMETSP0804-20121206/6840_1 /TAXON_ID=1074897 /ORGANISM="Tetraselmis astigmatica, Strain CCMP880" /LENGTH=346 /DNA_ID=CAMNT_0005466911 /DNA_START=37 /DNA_END=1077 /DNA_ORIENTATION=-